MRAHHVSPPCPNRACRTSHERVVLCRIHRRRLGAASAHSRPSPSYMPSHRRNTHLDAQSQQARHRRPHVLIARNVRVSVACGGSRWGAAGRSQRALNGVQPQLTALNGADVDAGQRRVAGQRVADRSLTRKRSLVRSQYRPPAFVQPPTVAIVGSVGDTRGLDRRRQLLRHARRGGVPSGLLGQDHQASAGPGGNRQLNMALRRIAVTEIRLDGLGRIDYQRRWTAGGTNRTASRPLRMPPRQNRVHQPATATPGPTGPTFRSGLTWEQVADRSRLRAVRAAR
jgi:hypothetical protein